MTLAVVIPLLKQDQAYLPDLLKSLSGQTQPPAEVIVCANFESAIESQGLPLRRLPNPTESIPVALNRAIAAAQSDYIVRLDVRARPQPTYLEYCLATLLTTEAAVVGGSLEIAAGAPTLLATAIALAVGHPLGAGDALYRLRPAEAHTVDTVPYPCFRKSLWQELGGFNENLWANEDYEFNWRVRARGGRIFLNPIIRTRYIARPTLLALAQQYYRYGWWKIQMLRQHPRSLQWRQALPVAALGFGALALVLALAFNFSAPLLLFIFIYLGLLVGSSLQLAYQQRSAQVVWLLPWAFFTVHLAWSLGAWTNLITFGRWPRR